MENIIKELKKYQHANITDKQWSKLVGEPFPGAIVEIYWTGLGDEPDYGYLFALEEQSPDEGDIMVHVPIPQNPHGKDEGLPQWVHLFNLLKNRRVKQIICSGGLLFILSHFH
jgi:hypothetical protein